MEAEEGNRLGEEERLQKFLARCGVGSRRFCEELIRSGRVCVDGQTAELGMTVDAGHKTVTVDGRPIGPEGLEYWLLNKPRGVVCTSKDPQGRPTVIGLVLTRRRVYPVGRLDLDSSGVLVVTNDGELAVRLTHPRYGVEKEYLVSVRGSVSQGAVLRLGQGVLLADGVTAPAQVDVLRRERDRTTLRVVLREGRNREVRRMLEAAGHSVISLHRSRIDGLTDVGLAPGSCRRLERWEIERLRAAVRLVRRGPGRLL